MFFVFHPNFFVQIMKLISRLFTFLVLTVAVASAGELVNADSHAKIALQGYDPVAFFTDGQPTKGSPLVSATHQGYSYLFASEAHKAEFEKHPEKYLPAYGGYCAFGVSKGKLFPVEIDTWEIVGGRLVLQYNQDVKKKFAADKEANLRKAEANWPKLQMQ
jgi:YHS domain-containing protein